MQSDPLQKQLRSLRKHRQSGQALIYGLFMLTVGLAALYFLFNVGQLTREKTKLVNTSDAVALSAGLMQARALNFVAYTNRALISDEVTIAQAISLMSWGGYLVQHGQGALGLGCPSGSSEPAKGRMPLYQPVCDFLATSSQSGALNDLNNVIKEHTVSMVLTAEQSKRALQTAQTTMLAALPGARQAVMQDVANANYAKDGVVQVDTVPLLDTYSSFNGNPFVSYYTGNARTPMRDLVLDIVSKDGFTQLRNWEDFSQAPSPSCLPVGAFYDQVLRYGQSQLYGFDEWVAYDSAYYFGWQLFYTSQGQPYCGRWARVLGTNLMTAQPGGTTSATSNNWQYSGIPNFADLSDSALAAPDPRAQFAVRVTREATQTRTSDARSAIQTTQRLNNYHNVVPTDSGTGKKMYVGLSAVETFFQRPVARTDGKNELASLFNPFWQAHLIEVPAAVRNQALAMQGVVMP